LFYLPSPFMGGRNVALLTELPDTHLAPPIYKHFAALRLKTHWTIHCSLNWSRICITMIGREKMENLLNLPVDERRRMLRPLQESLSGEDEEESRSPDGDQTSPAAKWLLSMAGRYSGGPGNTAARADEILRAEVT
jgi:hypothetical protein